MGAPIGKLNRENGVKIAKGAGIAMGGALLVYLAQLLPGLDFGSYTPLVTGVGAVAINALRELLKDEEGKIMGSDKL